MLDAGRIIIYFHAIRVNYPFVVVFVVIYQYINYIIYLLSDNHYQYTGIAANYIYFIKYINEYYQ